MKTLSFLPENFPVIAQHINSGLPAIVPTETCYGFSGDIESMAAIVRVEQIKGREQKPFLILVSDISDMGKYGAMNGKSDLYIKYQNETPTTFLLPKTEKIPKAYFPNFPDIGIRVCGYKPLQGFLSFLQKPIFSTSANISGFPPLYTSRGVREIFGHIPDLLFVDAGDLEIQAPSRIVKIEEDSSVHVLRA